MLKKIENIIRKYKDVKLSENNINIPYLENSSK